MDKERFFNELFAAVEEDFELVDEYEDFEDIEDCYFDVTIQLYESYGTFNYEGVSISYSVKATSNDGGYKRITSADIEVDGNEELDEWLDGFNMIDELDKISYQQYYK